MLQCGLLGEKLGHSYSPMIHNLFGDYAYELYERAPQELEAFLTSGAFDGLNVTIPYKKAVMPYCAELSDEARRIGSVNTIVRRADGTLYGDNTDAFGFARTVERGGMEPAGKKALVLGGGGASATACAVLRRMRAREVLVVSRTGGHNYRNLDRNADAELIVNTTPVGMHPNNGEAPLDLRRFPRLEGVIDVVYNPARTALLLQAERLGIPHIGGLHMLVAQAKRSSELFAGRDIPDQEIARVERTVGHAMENIVLIGMPGCGKTTIAEALAAKTGRCHDSSDAIAEELAGMTIPEIFARRGEDGFRALETEALSILGKRSGRILSTGGGCVTREENYPLLHQNGRIIWIRRDLEKLPTAGRPISQSRDLHELYAEREPLYERFADAVIDNNGGVDKTVEQIIKIWRGGK